MPRKTQKPKAGAPASERSPRKCANCGKTHAERVCPHPAVAREDRVCWTCGKKNHSSRECPDKPARTGGERQPLKAIEDMLRGKSVFSVTNEGDDGWRQASQIQRRPQPRKITVGDFMTTTITSNKYSALHSDNVPSRKHRQSVQPKEYGPVKAMQSASRKTPCTRTVLSADEMTLDELDRVIKEEENKFIAIMKAEEESESVSRKHRQSVQPKFSKNVTVVGGEEYPALCSAENKATITTPVPPYPPYF